ncbi:MAG TPA: RsmB/NOP family class I SAM-dependent RNA methyltransferase [Myxococcales bacterium]
MQRLRELPWGALRTDVVLPAIGRVLQGAAAELEVERALRSHPELSRDGRTAAVEAIFGVALWRRRLAWEASGSQDPAVLLLCLLRDLGGLPEAQAAALACAPPPPRRTDAPLRLGDLWSLPDWLEAHLLSELGDGAAAFCAAVAVPGPVCLRANRLLCTREELGRRLAGEGIETRPGALAPDALHVQGRNPNLFGSKAWREGLFEPQDEGSQLVGMLVEPLAGETVLDLCAGAGGKSLLLAAQGAHVLAHDPDRARTARLRTRAARAHATERIEIVPAPVAADRVLVDAPCSELGTLRRGPDARWRIDAARLPSFPPLQRQLLETAAALARQRIVYATCTVRRAENEEVALAFERAHPELRRTGTLHLLPHVDGTDGFFAVAWDRLRR